jgi:hypothetical protein
MPTEHTFRFPVYGTQGGGLVREGPNGTYIFVEKPSDPSLNVGDTMPAEWGIIPAKEMAREETDRDEYGL